MNSPHLCYIIVVALNVLPYWLAGRSVVPMSGISFSIRICLGIMVSVPQYHRGLGMAELRTNNDEVVVIT